MTNDATRCPYYQEESHNVKDRWVCLLPRDFMMINLNKGVRIPNNREDCEVWTGFVQGKINVLK